MCVEHIAERDLADLVDRQIRHARASGICHVRRPRSFARHLCEVAVRSESVARQLCAVMPRHCAPDPLAAFVAGAWHDGGKMRGGDDYHEIVSACELLAYGREWRLVDASDADPDGVLLRAARAVLPGFAIYEQWQSPYQPAHGDRFAVEPMFDTLCDTLCPDCRDPVVELLLPRSIDALVVMYADLTDVTAVLDAPSGFDAGFDARWSAIVHAARQDDPALHAILHTVKERVYDGCRLIDRFLNGGFDESALARFVSKHSMGAATTLSH